MNDEQNAYASTRLPEYTKIQRDLEKERMDKNMRNKPKSKKIGPFLQSIYTVFHERWPVTPDEACLKEARDNEELAQELAIRARNHVSR